jgi:hypothetical protein
VVVNDKDGHFDNVNEDYKRVIEELQAVCVSVLGYVHDCYDNTSVEPPLCPRTTDIMDDVDRWFSTYRVDGIFIDQLLPNRVQHAASLVQQVRSRHPGTIVVLNPGTIPTEDFMMQTHPAVVVIQEGSVSGVSPTFNEDWPPDGWVSDRAMPTPPAGAASIAARRLAIIGHTAPNPEHVDYLIAKAKQYNIGWVYAQHVTGSTYNPLSIHLRLLTERVSLCYRLGCTLPFGPLLCRLVSYLICYILRINRRLRRIISGRVDKLRS